MCVLPITWNSPESAGRPFGLLYGAFPIYVDFHTSRFLIFNAIRNPFMGYLHTKWENPHSGKIHSTGNWNAPPLSLFSLLIGVCGQSSVGCIHQPMSRSTMKAFLPSIRKWNQEFGARGLGALYGTEKLSYAPWILYSQPYNMIQKWDTSWELFCFSLCLVSPACLSVLSTPVCPNTLWPFQKS